MPNPPEIIPRLIERFERNAETYRSQAFNETELRVELVNPFWKALGWDMDNEDGHAMAYRDVIHEDAIKVGAPDYCFRIGGMRKFFLEAKKPAVNLKDDPSPAYQLRRYGWSAKLSISLLTDFAELAVYDCRIRPKVNDKASIGRLKFYHHTEYVDKWDEISSVFSHEAVLKGSFDKFADSTRDKHGTSEVDAEFLKEIENWREILAKNIALRNPALDVHGLNFAVQVTIDRIIFLRMCEDRGIERDIQLLRLCDGPRIYTQLLEVYRKADEKYNSGLFHFQDEKGRGEAPDTLTPKLAIDDKTLKEIISRLYYPESPYEFSILPAEILGNVYEQFLGKVIRLTSDHHAKVEEKPEVRKAGGVYYTPAYIVSCIVKNIVGKLCEGKSPKEVSQLRVVDPACGSGSFLLGAYQYLLDWHLRWYQAELTKTGKPPQSPPPEGKRQKKGDPQAIYETPRGWQLTTTEKKRILLNNLYGVDIDSQAVEVTKLSLLLKVLEDESQETLRNQLTLWHERALPDLADNIKCGNSLIGPDFYGKPGQASLFADGDTRERVNIFDWNDPERGFGEIMNAGGFDAVIGNPPYIRIQAMKEWAPVEVEHYKEAYKAAAKGNYDIYVVFIEKGLALLNSRGRLGFICPHKFFNAQYGESIRKIIAEGQHLGEVVHFGDQQVFSGATTYTCLLFLEKLGVRECRFVKVNDLALWRQKQSDTKAAVEGQIASERITAADWNFSVGKGTALFEKLSRMPTKLENITSRIFQGIKTGADKIFIVEERERNQKKVRVYSPHLETECWLEPDLLHPLVKGGDSRRYALSLTKRLILFPYARDASGKASLVSENILRKQYPLTSQYLERNIKYLREREDGKMDGASWYAYSRSQALDVMPLVKIFTPDIAPSARYSLDSSGDAFFTGGVSGGYGILPEKTFDGRYVLGLLNSKLLDWFHHQFATQMRGGWYSYESRFICGLPIRPIDSGNRNDREMHDRLVQLVQSMLDLQGGRSKAKTPTDQARFDRDLAVLDGEIDDLVYRLYALTPEEIRIIQGPAA